MREFNWIQKQILTSVGPRTVVEDHHGNIIFELPVEVDAETCKLLVSAYQIGYMAGRRGEHEASAA